MGNTFYCLSKIMATSLLRKSAKRDSTLRIKRYLPSLGQNESEANQEQLIYHRGRHLTTTSIDKDIAKLFSTLNISNVDSKAENLECDAHPEENLDFYCTRCERQCCIECRADDHTVEGCDVKPASVAVIEKLTAKKDYLYFYSKVLTMYMDKYNEEHAGLYGKIEETLQIMDNFNVKDVELLASKSESVMAEMSKNHAFYKSMKAQVISILTAFSNLQSLTPSRAMKRLGILEQDIDKLVHTELVHLSWKVNIENKDLLSSESVLAVDLETRQFKTGDAIQDIELEYDTRVVGMVKVFKYVVVLHSENNNLCIFSEGKIVQKVAISDIQNPLAMELLNITNVKAIIGIVNINKGTLIFLTFNNALQLTDKKVHLLNFTPTDISVTECSDTFLIMDPENKCFHLYDTSGQEKKVIQINPSAVSTPVKAASTQNGYIVLDFDNNVAVILDKHGIFLHSYGNSSKDQPIATGTHVSVDSLGNILIADADHHRIQQLYMDGTFLRHILQKEDGIGFPTRLFLDTEKNNLYVAHHPRGIEKRGSIRVAHYMPVPSSNVNINLSVNIK